ncbi:peptidoglycan-binding domain-containing protein [Ferrovibrio sp.]|jgi:hypothetical protein|uniref:peptidoglycan-binding domain-containing protein n=1 Tax=Ferrovibrio sp. TaxID=1917215 RepID=UPI0035B3EBF0
MKQTANPARYLALQSPLGRDHVAEPADILDAKRALMALGYYQSLGGDPPGAWVDNELFTGIRKFQRDQGLKIDGLMRPGGETEAAMNAALDQQPEPPANDDQPPANDDQPDTALLDCDMLLMRDRLICDRLKTSQLSAICHGSAMSRYGNCLSNRPLGPLTTRV